MSRSILKLLPVMLCLVCLGAGGSAQAQGTISAGPVVGHTTKNTVRVWFLFKNATRVAIQHEQPGGWSDETYVRFSHEQGWRKHYPLVYEMSDLAPGREWKLRIKIDDETNSREFSFRTLDARWPEEFSFLAGSCAYLGKGLQKLPTPRSPTEIFSAMSQKSSDFMLWLGDNTYYIWPEYKKPEKMVRKQIYVRLNEDFNRFLTHKRHYAIWDDHDFGPNNSDSRFELRDTALAIFQQFWPNPPSGDGSTKGNFYSFTYSDAEFFMLDDRFHRKDSLNQCILGKEQMEWLKNKLMQSQATFKFVALGSQIINEKNEHETWFKYRERREFFSFLQEKRIEGVIFLSGDRHFTEMQKMDRLDAYPLYDLTCSPLTSWVRKKAGKDHEAVNAMRVPGTQVLQQNFAKLTIFGPGGQRVLRIDVFDMYGMPLWNHHIKESELKYPR